MFVSVHWLLAFKGRAQSQGEGAARRLCVFVSECVCVCVRVCVLKVGHNRICTPYMNACMYGFVLP